MFNNEFSLGQNIVPYLRGTLFVLVLLSGLVSLPLALAQELDLADALDGEVEQLYRAGRYNDAIPLAELSLRIRESTLGTSHPLVATSLNNLAELYKAESRYAEAEPLYKRSLSLLESAPIPNHAYVGGALNNLAELYRIQGRYAEAEPLYERSLAIRKMALGADHPAVAESLNNRGLLHQALGHYAEAEQLLKESLGVYKRALGSDSTEAALLHNNLADLYRVQGRYAEAEPLYKRSLSLLESAPIPNHAYVGGALNNLAELYRIQGRYAEAEPLYGRSLAIRETALGAHHRAVAESLSNLASLYRTQRRYTDAEPHYERALTILKAVVGPEHPSVATAVNNLALMYQDQGRDAPAESLYKRALAINEKALGVEHPDVAKSLTNLGVLYVIRRRYAEAEPLFKRALAIGEHVLGLQHPDVAATLGYLATLHFVQGHWTSAAEFWRRSTQIIAQRSERGAAALNQAPMASGKSEATRANLEFGSFVKAAHRTTANGQQPTRGLTLEMFETVQWALSSAAGASLAKMAARGAAGDAALASLVRKRQDLLAEWEKRDAMQTAAVSQPPEKRNKSAEAVNAVELTEIARRIREIDTRLSKEFPDYATFVSPKPLSIDGAQSLLRGDEALVLFFDTLQVGPAPEETFIWVVTKTDSRWVRSDLGTKKLQESVALLRCGLDRDGNWRWSDEESRWIARKPACASLRLGGLGKHEPLPFDLSRAHELYQGLFGQVEDLIKGKQLLLVPSGALTALPFQVLVTAAPTGNDLASAAWLIRDHALTVLPSVSSLAALRRNAKASAAPEPFVGFGDPALSGSPFCGTIEVPEKCPDEELTVAGLPSHLVRIGTMLTTVASYFRNGQADIAEVRKLCPLPDTAHELKCVARSLGAPESSIMLGKDMTETVVKTMALDRYRIVHFATHGLLAGQTAQLAKAHAEPALVFTPPETPTDEDDGLLTASEVTGLRLDADWVVMSACNTAGGAEPGAEALSGLAKAFFYAGAHALLVSHWPVNSYAATMLTSRAFDELRKNPSIGRSEAFRRAMFALMGDPKRTWAARPSVWAPFVVVGEGGSQAAH